MVHGFSDGGSGFLALSLSAASCILSGLHEQILLGKRSGAVSSRVVHQLALAGG